MTFQPMLMMLVILQGGWTWTLYEDGGPLVLANEVPDTPQLRTVLECRPGSGVARVDLYGDTLGSGFAIIASGNAAATGQTGPGTGKQSVVLRIDHPVFAQFMDNGTLDVAVAGVHQTIAVPADHLGKLRRFAELCAG